MKVIGSRRRGVIGEDGSQRIYVIRRLKCTKCKRIHHELPDFLIPYKRYECKIIESVIVDDVKQVILEADETTLYNWRNWFHKAKPYWIGCLRSIELRLNIKSVGDLANNLSLSLHKKLQINLLEPGWLSKIVHMLVNMNLWVHTRIA